MDLTLSGIIPALVTPMADDQALDLPRLAGLVDELVQAGVRALVPLGSTGEFYALTPRERRAVLSTTLEAVANRVPVIAGANGGSTAEIIGYCRESQERGAAGVLLTAPYYSIPSLDELFEHFRLVNDAIDIPIIVYNNPGRTGVDMRPEFIERLCQLPHIKYVKESSGDTARIAALVSRCGDRLGILCGTDTAALESLVVGAVGWIAGSANILTRSHVRLFDLATQERSLAAAKAVYFSLLPTLRLLEGGGKYIQWVKGAAWLLGHPVGPPRRPLMPATEIELRLLRDALARCPESELVN